MFDEKIELKKKRDFSDVINASFGFLRQEYKNLGKVLLVYAGIPVLVQAILSGFYVDTTLTEFFRGLGNPSSSQDFVQSMPGKAMLFNLINLIVQVFLTGLAYCYIVEYAQKGSKNIDIKSVWDKFISFFGAFLGFNILSGLVIVLAFIALIVPGIYVMVPLSLILIVKVAEDEGYGDTFSRCFYLIKNHWWETFGLLIISTIILLTISSAFSIPAVVIAGAKGLLQQDTSLMSTSFIITSIISTIGTAIVTPIPAIVTAFQYYSLVEHKDNSSLLDRIEKINEPKTDNE